MQAKLSAPYYENISSSIAIEALPETGLVTIKGISSEGTPTLESGTLSNSETKSSAPETLSIFTDMTRAHSVGRIEKEVDIPSFAPVIKLSK